MREVKATHTNVISVGYCNLQYMLRSVQPYAYTTRSEGWGADVYSFGNVAIATGYAPFGDIRPSYDLKQQYEMKAQKIFEDKRIKRWDTRKNKLRVLISEFIETAIKESNEKGIKI